MYYDYDEFENCYESTPADEIFNEAMEKFKEVLKDSVKNNLKYIQEENKRLKKENDELKKREREISSKEHMLDMREKDWESRTEWTFYKKKFSEMLNPLEECVDFWKVDYEYRKRAKCSLCDDNREITFSSPQGKEIKEKCDCDKTYRFYKPLLEHISIIKLWKSANGKEFSVTPKYDNNDYDDRYCSLSVDEIINFNIEDVDKYRSYNSIFKTKDDCQKFCDWLNEKSKEDDIDTPKTKS